MRGLPLHRLLAPGAAFVAPGTVRGRLLDLGAYPGLVAGAGRVRGELYRVHRPELLGRLDREEGYNFERRRAWVQRADGPRALAWIYRYIGPRGRARPLSAGDWRQRWP